MDYIDKVITDKVDNYEIHDNRIHEFQDSSKNKLLYVDENLQVAETDNIVKDVVDKDGTSLKQNYIVSLKDYATLDDVEPKENKSNKISEFHDTMTDDEYPTAVLVKNNLDKKITNPVEKSIRDVLQFDGEKWIAGQTPSNFVLDSIKINKLPDKTIYILDGGEEDVQTDGMEVIAQYRNANHPNVIFSVIIKNEGLELIPKKITPSTESDKVEQKITVNFTDADITCETSFNVIVTSSLEKSSWKYINDLISNGIAELVWDIGDTKKLLFPDVEHDVFVMDVGHADYGESDNKNFTFGMFIHKYTDGDVEKRNLVGITDEHYGESSESNKGWYVMNPTSDLHITGTNNGGWKNSSMRQSVLGSNSYTPSFAPEGTLLSKLPTELKDVMKRFTVYTDNLGGKVSTFEAVTGTDEYLPLLSENEVFGSKAFCNEHELYYSKQYKFFEYGNITMVHDIKNNDDIVYCWLRSPTANTDNEFCQISGEKLSTVPEATSGLSYFSYAIMPIFRV